MNDDYLWDKSGRDGEVEALERLLAPAALGATPNLGRRRAMAWIAGAAAAVIIGIGFSQSTFQTAGREEWVATGDGYSRLDLGKYGHVVAEPGSQVRVLRRDNEMQRLRLDRGTIHASITREARPRLFQVETPAATCIDLGCHYTLSVDPSGLAQVSVSTGRVAFHDGRREVFIPEGASGRAAAGRAPFTPIHDDASEPLKRAVTAFDGAPEGNRAKLAKEACKLITRRQDGLVAWHFLQDSEKAVKAAAREALVRLTHIGECGVPPVPEKELNDQKAWRDRLFPEWSSWD